MLLLISHFSLGRSSHSTVTTPSTTIPSCHFHKEDGLAGVGGLFGGGGSGNVRSRSSSAHAPSRGAEERGHGRCRGGGYMGAEERAVFAQQVSSAAGVLHGWVSCEGILCKTRAQQQARLAAASVARLAEADATARPDFLFAKADRMNMAGQLEGGYNSQTTYCRRPRARLLPQTDSPATHPSRRGGARRIHSACVAC